MPEGVSERMKGFRGRQTGGCIERARGETEGEGKAFTSCGNTHFSHELIQSRKVTYSIANARPKKGRMPECLPCFTEPLFPKNTARVKRRFKFREIKKKF